MRERDGSALVDLIVDSALFDSEVYGRSAGRTFATPSEAAAHYLNEGWRRDLTPSALFDSRHYKALYPDVVADGQIPLVHYLRHGRLEGREIRLSKAPLAEPPTAPSRAAWEALAMARRAAPRDVDDVPGGVDVIVPVYDGFDDSLACLYSVLVAENQADWRLMVIYDAGPDPRLGQALDWLAGLGLFQLLRNDRNLGFVRTVNRGMALSRHRDVLLLNADTLVYGAWIDRLRHHARSQARAATVTPFSNNATVFSYPFAHRNNNQRLELDFGALDQVFSQVNAGASLDVPTGVGFCFYMTRAALDDIGPFDADSFGQGYGEENDYCLRALKSGWRNLAALDVFVRHTGEVSFAASGVARREAARIKLLALHPDYEQRVAAFVRDDPLRPARAAVDQWRARRLGDGRGVLMIEHGWGGGVARHVDDLSALLAREGRAAFTGRADARAEAFTLQGPAGVDLPNLPDLPWNDAARFAEGLRAMGVTQIHVHSLVGAPVERLPALGALLIEAAGAYDVTLHDYIPLCPRIAMVDASGVFCDSPSTAYCAACVDRLGTPFGPVDVEAWRDRYGRFLSGARRLFAPSHDVRRRYGAMAPDLPAAAVRPHPRLQPFTPRACASTPDLPRRVGVIGGLSAAKGASVLLRLVADARVRGLPLTYVLYGWSDDPQLAAADNLTVTGRYEDADFAALFARSPCDVALFPSVTPETFSYALDHAFAQNTPPLVFDLGALAERVRATGFGQVAPLAWANAPDRLNDALLAMPLSGLAAADPEPERRWRSGSAYYDGP